MKFQMLQRKEVIVYGHFNARVLYLINARIRIAEALDLKIVLAFSTDVEPQSLDESSLLVLDLLPADHFVVFREKDVPDKF